MPFRRHLPAKAAPRWGNKQPVPRIRSCLNRRCTRGWHCCSRSRGRSTRTPRRRGSLPRHTATRLGAWLNFAKDVVRNSLVVVNWANPTQSENCPRWRTKCRPASASLARFRLPSPGAQRERQEGQRHQPLGCARCDVSSVEPEKFFFVEEVVTRDVQQSVHEHVQADQQADGDDESRPECPTRPT